MYRRRPVGGSWRAGRQVDMESSEDEGRDESGLRRRNKIDVARYIVRRILRVV